MRFRDYCIVHCVVLEKETHRALAGPSCGDRRCIAGYQNRWVVFIGVKRSSEAAEVGPPLLDCEVHEQELALGTMSKRKEDQAGLLVADFLR